MENKNTNEIKTLLESIYKKYHKPGYIHPDPLELILPYADPADREIAGLIASSLAMGRVASILDAVTKVLQKVPDLKKGLTGATKRDLTSLFRGFKYRFYTETHLVNLLWGIRGVVLEYGSLNECFLAGYSRNEPNLLPAQHHFTEAVKKAASGDLSTLLPEPGKKSACKRLNLYLRWMIRKDRIDPGGWEGIPQRKLTIPLDTHMHKAATHLGFTTRKQGDQTTAQEITEGFRIYSPSDPLRYDFCLTRLGIHPDLTFDDLIRL